MTLKRSGICSGTHLLPGDSSRAGAQVGYVEGAVISGLCWGHPRVLTWMIPEMLLGRTTRLQPFRDEARALPLAPGVSDSTWLCDTPNTA